MSAKEYVWIIKESSLNTAMASPVAGTDSIYIRLTDGNAFTMQADTIIEEIPVGYGFAVTGEAIADKYSVKGALKTKLYPAQQALLMDWAVTRVAGTGTTPWATTEPDGDLPSCTVYHAIKLSDGSYRRKKFTGVKVDAMKIDVSSKSTSATLTLTLTGCKALGHPLDSTSDPSGTEFPAPADTAYPNGPYTFKHTSTGLKIATVRTAYDSIALSVDNTLDGQYFESTGLSVLQWCGRKTSMDVDMYLKPSPDDRASYDGNASLDTELTFNNGSKTLKIDFNAKNHISKLSYTTPLGGLYMQKLSLVNRWDPATSTDIAVSYT